MKTDLEPSSEISPQLDAPGAGLPTIELWIARRLFRWRARTTSREAAAVIGAELDKIRALAGCCDATEGMRRVLIPRLRGLEDSSRYWSVFMTAAHVRIANRGARRAITELLAGRQPGGVVSTAAIKPDPTAGIGEIAELERSCEELLELERATESLKTKLKHAHPWFGPLDAADWFFLAGFHMALHRRQIEVILAQSRPPQG